jgi:hypothetical protein
VTAGLLDRRAVCPPCEAVLRRRDLDVLAWVAEQYAVRLDQLEPLLGCRRTVQRTVARMREANLVETRRLLVGEPGWLLPTATGLRTCGSSFRAWQPRLALMAHVAAVTDVRLHIGMQAPGSVWVCERTLARERRSDQHLPDALVLVDGQRVAIEVELTVKSRRRVTGILEELSARFDSAVYFCAAGPYRQLSGLAASGRWPKLGVRELPPST